jgi:FHS family L-fucose permease-like MFS transporter
MLHGGLFSAAAAGAATPEMRAASLHNVGSAFLLIAIPIALLLLFIWRVGPRLTRVAPPPAPGRDSVLHALQSAWAVMGGIAIFLYVGAEVSIGSMLINFLSQTDVLAIDLENAGKLVSLYWLGAMIGRFAGSAALTRMRATLLLTLAAAIAAALCLTVSQQNGQVAAVCAIAVGLCNSIMFPNIFTITLERSSASAAATSGLLCVAIVGGALLPQVSGAIIDHVGDPEGRHVAFLLPMAAYLGISLFAFLAGRVEVRPPATV